MSEVERLIAKVELEHIEVFHSFLLLIFVKPGGWAAKTASRRGCDLRQTDNVGAAFGWKSIENLNIKFIKNLMVVCDKGFKKVFLQPRRARGNFKANVN